MPVNNNGQEPGWGRKLRRARNYVKRWQQKGSWFEVEHLPVTAQADLKLSIVRKRWERAQALIAAAKLMAD